MAQFTVGFATWIMWLCGTMSGWFSWLLPIWLGRKRAPAPEEKEVRKQNRKTRPQRQGRPVMALKCVCMFSVGYYVHWVSVFSACWSFVLFLKTMGESNGFVFHTLRVCFSCDSKSFQSFGTGRERAAKCCSLKLMGRYPTYAWDCMALKLFEYMLVINS